MNGIKKNEIKICFVSIDVESDFATGQTFEGVANLDKILKIFEKDNLPVTLFVVGNVLERYAQQFKQWKNSYEIASHSFSHRFWNNLRESEREEELEKFINLYQKVFNQNPKGFRAPSHVIDEKGLQLLKKKGFLYDSSIVPDYPFFKRYRGYRKKETAQPNWRGEKFLEIPVSGQIFGVPIAGTWISKLPFFVYQFLFLISQPKFLTFSLHSWDSLNSKLLIKIEAMLTLLKAKNYQFLSGEQIYELFSKN